MFRSISSRLILAVSILVAAACAVMGTFSVFQQRALTRLMRDQQLRIQYEDVIIALASEGRAALAVSSVAAALPPVRDAVATGDRDALMALPGGAQAALQARTGRSAGGRLALVFRQDAGTPARLDRALATFATERQAA